MSRSGALRKDESWEEINAGLFGAADAMNSRAAAKRTFDRYPVPKACARVPDFMSPEPLESSEQRAAQNSADYDRAQSYSGSRISALGVEMLIALGISANALLAGLVFLTLNSNRHDTSELALPPKAEVIAEAAKPAEAQPAAEVKAADGKDDLEHVVNLRGETLGVIAAWYTGDAKLWTEIVKANPGLKPEAMYISQKIKIPGNLVKKRDKLTQAALNAGPKPKKAQVAAHASR